MKKSVRFTALLLALLFLPSCTKTTVADPVFAFDTVFTQTVIGGDLISASVITNDEYFFSRTLAQSELYRLNEAGSGEAGNELDTLLSEAMRLAKQTDGAFDFTLAPVSDLWDFTSGKDTVPEEAALSAALEHTGYERVTKNENGYELNGVTVDLGGIAKGYEIGDLLAAYRRQNVKGALVSCSSSVGVIGEKENGSAFTVGLRNPNGSANDLLGVFTLKNSILSTSGDYERFFIKNGVRYHHILNPETGLPVQNGLRSVTVVSPLAEDYALTGARTDALATALFVMGMGERALSLLADYGMEAVFVTDDGIFLTAGLRDCFSSDRAVTVLE